MTLLRTTIFVSFVALGAATAWAQFGLYGSPEMLNLPQAQPAIGAYSGYATPPGYPGPTAAPAGQAAPTATGYAPPGQYYPGSFVQTAAAGQGANQAAGLPAAPPPPMPPSLTADTPQGGAPRTGLNLVDQMLQEASPSDGNSYDDTANDQCGGIRQAVDCFEEAACGDSCGGYDCMPGSCRSPWYAAASVLVMGRNDANRLWTTHESPPPITNEANQLMNTQDIDLEWGWGGEIVFGRRFCCDRWAVEATYWTLDPFFGEIGCTHPSNVSTPLTVGNVEFNGQPGTDWFDNAAGHRLSRRNEFHNVEVNLVRSQIMPGYDLPWDIDWSVGVRYFRFEENLVFGAVANGFWWGQDPAEEAYLDDRITNDLVGFQVGCTLNYNMMRSLRLFVAPKFGIYNNHMDHYFQAYLGDGTVAQPSVASGQTGSYPVRSSTDALSFLTEIDVGVEWQFLRNWSARMGYRVVAVTGVGLSDNQIPPYIVDIPEIADIDTNGDLILHGAFAGLTYSF